VQTDLRELALLPLLFAKACDGFLESVCQTTSQLNPLPLLLIRPTDGEGKCAVQHQCQQYVDCDDRLPLTNDNMVCQRVVI